ncbi:hypothetical protein ACWD4V_02250 [Streptomyces tsukubensis]
MSPRSKTRLCLGLLVAVLTLGLGTALSWPVWIWFLLPTLLAGVFLVTMGMASDALPRGTDGSTDPFGTAPPVEPPYLESSLLDVPLPSAMADYPFLLSATVWWRTAPRFSPAAHSNPAALALTSVLQRAQYALAAEHPNRCGFLGPWLEGHLGVPVTDESGTVTAFAAGVRVTLRPTDQQRLDEMDDARKSRDLWESRRQHELDRRAYLGEDVLRTPGSAMVWWLSRHEEDIERAVTMIGPLVCLSAAANDREVPEEFRSLYLPCEAAESDPPGGFGHPDPFDLNADPDHAPDRPLAGHRAASSAHVSALLDEMDLPEGSDERVAFIHRLARVSEASGRPEAADTIRRDLLTHSNDDPTTPPEQEADVPPSGAAPHTVSSTFSDNSDSLSQPNGVDPARSRWVSPQWADSDLGGAEGEPA